MTDTTIYDETVRVFEPDDDGLPYVVTYVAEDPARLAGELRDWYNAPPFEATPGKHQLRIETLDMDTASYLAGVLLTLTSATRVTNERTGPRHEPTWTSEHTGPCDAVQSIAALHAAHEGHTSVHLCDACRDEVNTWRPTS